MSVRQRPGGLRDTRGQWACLFGAVCPGRGTAAGLVLPFANTEAMRAHPAGITRAVAPGARAPLVLDGTGWQAAQGSYSLKNFPLLTLPP